MSDQFSGPPEVTKEFDRWGRRLLPDPVNPGAGMVPWTRATTLAKSTDDFYNLHRWEMRMVAKGIGVRDDLYALAASLDPEEDRDALMKVADDAVEAAKGRAGANRGTALHSWTKTQDAGQEANVPAQWTEHLDVYRRGMLANGYATRQGLIERVVVNTKCKSAGQFDRLLSIKSTAIVDDEEFVIGDLKSEKGDFEYSAMRTAAQMAIYANADWLWDADRREYVPMPRVNLDYAIVIHLPSTEKPTFQLYKVDIRAGWEIVQTCLEVRRARSRKGLMQRIGTPVTMHTLPETITAAVAAGPVVPAAAIESKPTPSRSIGGKGSARAAALSERMGWINRAEAVTTDLEASTLWREATDAGVWDAALEAVARRALTSATAKRAAETVSVVVDGYDEVNATAAEAEIAAVETLSPNAPVAATSDAPAEPSGSVSVAVGTAEPEVPAAPAQPARDWPAEAAACRTRGDASALWQAAKAADAWTDDLKATAFAAITAAGN